MNRSVVFLVLLISLNFSYDILCSKLRAESQGLSPVSKERLKTKAALLQKVDAAWGVDTRVAEPSSYKAQPSHPILEKLNNLIIPKLQLSDMPLSRALELLSELSAEMDPDKQGINMVLIDPQGLNPLVSLHLRHCSLRKILGFLSKSSQFAYEVHEDTLVFEYSPGSPLTLETEFFPLARATVIRLVDKEFQQQLSSAKGCSLSVLEEEEALKVFFQKAGIDFEHTPGSSLAFEGTQLIVTHTPRHLQRLYNLLERYKDIKQVEIEARFLEVQEGILEELGFRWSAQRGEKRIGTGSGARDNLRSLSQAYAGQSTNGGEGRISIDGTTFPITNNLPSIPNALNLGSQAVPTANLMGVFNAWDLNVMIKALEQHGGSDLMSAPKLTVLSGKTAQIVVAQEFRYPESFGDIGSEVGSTNLNGGGSAGVSITAGTPRNFTVRNIGVEMEVTPTVEMNNYITLTLEPKVTEFEGFVEYGGSSIAVTGNTSVNIPSGFIQPIFSVRKIKTQFTIANGQIAVIGGLAREEVVKVQDKVPLLGDIPLLGRLFQSKSETNQKRNLIIFVSANLVDPNGQLYSAVP